jgi:signal transduction histidine kinase
LAAKALAARGGKRTAWHEQCRMELQRASFPTAVMFANSDTDAMRAPAHARTAQSGGATMLERVAQSALDLTGGMYACVLRPGSPAGAPVIVAAAGTPVPLHDGATRHVLPLVIDDVEVGKLVVDSASAHASQPQLALLAALAAAALENEALLAETGRQMRRLAYRQYQLLSGTIYHLKNVLGTASEYIELLDIDGELSADQRGYVKRSRASIDAGLRLLTELHELGRSDAGELVPQPEPLNLAALIREVVEDHRLAAGAANIHFVLQMRRRLPPLRTDPDCVRQILDNLLSNAVRYSPSDGTVRVRVSVRRGRRASDPAYWIRIDVSDSGPGVAEGAAVFEEIERVQHKGTAGFRLAISRRVARLLGGELLLKHEDRRRGPRRPGRPGWRGGEAPGRAGAVPAPDPPGAAGAAATGATFSLLLPAD